MTRFGASDPKTPLPGAGGVNINSREFAHEHRGLGSRFLLHINRYICDFVIRGVIYCVSVIDLIGILVNSEKYS